MKTLKLKRNTSIFAGICFLLSTMLFLLVDKTLELRSIFMAIACIIASVNAYNAHKKVLENKN